MEVFLAFLRTGDWSWGRNDLQSVAERLCPMVRQCIDQLAAVGIAARMTGSGSAVFAVLTSASQVQAFNQIVWPSGWQARVCNGMPQHPLCGW
jgi:4-diphosphocytidyl-2-C-methyl-D-erythritol kinase